MMGSSFKFILALSVLLFRSISAGVLWQPTEEKRKEEGGKMVGLSGSSSHLSH